MKVKLVTSCEACHTSLLVSLYGKHICPALFPLIRYNGDTCCLLCDAEDNEVHFCNAEDVIGDRIFLPKHESIISKS